MATRDHRNLDHLFDALKRGRVSRRDFLVRAVALGCSLPMAQALLAQRGVDAATGSAISRAVSRAQGQPKKGGQVIVGLSQEPTLFNPMLSNLEVDRGVQFGIFDSLWRIDENAQFVPNLATEIPTVANGGVSADGLTYTFKLRNDVKWHDGQPFTAKDVLFTHTKIMDPKINSPIKLGHDKVKSIAAPDDATVAITMNEPFAPFLIVWSDTYLVPEHILSAVPDINTADFNSTKPVGTGPFTFVERVPGDHITLAANPTYHGPGPYLDKVIFQYIPDLTAMFTKFKTGEIDVTGIQGITADHYDEAKALPGKVINLGKTAVVEFILPNFGNPILADKAVRQAMYATMDKDGIINQVYDGVQTPSETYLAESSWAFDPDLPKQKYDPAAAKQILDAAGWTAGGDGIRVKDGKKLSFTNSTTAGNKVREQAQQYLQQTWKDVGIDMQIKNMPAAVIWGDYFNKSQFDTVMVGEISGVGGDPDATVRFHSLQIPLATGAGQNTGQYKNPDVDKLLEDGAQEVDQAKRKPIYVKLQEILLSDLAYLPIFHYVLVEGTKQGLINYKQNAFVVSNMWNVFEWSWAS
jgi:peptide/nickel transport system substrate-binding protein